MANELRCVVGPHAHVHKTIYNRLQYGPAIVVWIPSTASFKWNDYLDDGESIWFGNARCSPCPTSGDFPFFYFLRTYMWIKVAVLIS